MLDLNKPLEIVTSAGEVRPFTLLSSEARGNFPIIGYVGNGESLFRFDRKGTSVDESSNAFVLRNVECNTTLYVNMYSNGTCVTHRTQLSATQNAGWDSVRIAVPFVEESRLLEAKRIVTEVLDGMAMQVSLNATNKLRTIKDL